MISSQLGRVRLAIRRNTLDRAYEQLLEAMTVLHSGTLFTTVRVNEDGSIDPISLVLCLDDVTTPELDEWAAFAESMAAMHLLLSTIELEMAPIASVLARPCIPEANQPIRTYLDGGFRSYPDSWTFSAGVRQARELIGEPGNPVGLIDLGCGSAAPMIEALVDGSIDYYIGVDLDPEALRQARLNLATINQKRYRIDQLDVTQRDAAARIKSHMARFPVNTIWILGANLPYLPTPEGGLLDRATDGGRRGLDLMPRFPLALATDLGSELVVLNVSSLCDLDGFLDGIETTPFLARRFIGTVAPLEAYARKVVDYVRTHRIGRPYDSYQAQIICAYVLQRASGISAKKAMTYLERLLVTPTLQPDLAVACGDASGEVTILTPMRPLVCRSLAFSVARSARDHAGEI